jgi:hypothetical protein
MQGAENPEVNHIIQTEESWNLRRVETSAKVWSLLGQGEEGKGNCLSRNMES